MARLPRGINIRGGALSARAPRHMRPQLRRLFLARRGPGARADAPVSCHILLGCMLQLLAPDTASFLCLICTSDLQAAAAAFQSQVSFFLSL